HAYRCDVGHTSVRSDARSRRVLSIIGVRRPAVRARRAPDEENRRRSIGASYGATAVAGCPVTLAAFNSKFDADLLTYGVRHFRHSRGKSVGIPTLSLRPEPLVLPRGAKRTFNPQ